jgi:hypothetical protein
MDRPKELYEPKRENRLTSPTENRRVRQLYWHEKVRMLGGFDHPMGHGGRGTCSDCKRFRGQLAADWVDLAERAQSMTDVELVVPGLEFRRPLRPGETITERRVDAARTRIREFEAGANQGEWVLIGLETTIAERNGLAFPGGAYRSQRRLDV